MKIYVMYSFLSLQAAFFPSLNHFILSSFLVGSEILLPIIFSTLPKQIVQNAKNVESSEILIL